MEYKNRLGSRLQVRKIKEDFKFSSLFSRLVTVYISILTIILMILFITFTNTFRDYFVDYTKDLMIKQAEKLAEEFYKLEHFSTYREEGIEKIFYRMEVLESQMESTTWIMRQDGQIYMFSSNEIKAIDNQMFLNKEDIEKVFEGNIVGIENGFKEYFSTPVLTVGYPIETNGETLYALFIHTPLPIILSTIDEVRNIILQVVGLIGSILFIWIYFIAKRMTNPLKEMNIIAKQIASGQFNKRIAITGKDEIAQLATSFNNMAQELDKIEENRNSFIANISHDLRSPLTSIQGFVTAMLDGTIPAQNQQKYLEIVLNESKRMINMTNKILDLSKLEEGRATIEKVPLNINRMLQNSVLTLENHAKDKGVTITMSFDEQHQYIMGDMDGISRVIQNLLDNALKFVNENGEINVKTSYYDHKVWVRISNSGMAISEEQQKMIWNRFYKGDRSRGQDKRGVGLGLVIVKEILKQHGETVGVHSKPGEMVTFYFSLTPQKESYEN